MSDFLSHLVARSLDLTPRSAVRMVRPRLPSRFESRLDPVASDLEPLGEETTKDVARLPNGLPRAEAMDLLPRRQPGPERLAAAAPPGARVRSPRPPPEGEDLGDSERGQPPSRAFLHPLRRGVAEAPEPTPEMVRPVQPAERPLPPAVMTPRQTSHRIESVIQGLEKERQLVPIAPEPAPDAAPTRTILQPRVERVEREPVLVPRDEPTPEPVIHVTIGRIEVRATPASKPRVRERPATSPAVDLDEYLRQRARGDRR